ncbi:MAG: hypothetical protein RIR00_1720 [Pseudomonadota bacterium]|jgi:hypothetical protein
MEENLARQHAAMREMLDRLNSFKELTFRSEIIPTLLSDFLFQVCQHFKSERAALSSVFESDEEKTTYDAHYLYVLEEISDIQFGLLFNQDMRVAAVLPRMAEWVDRHENLHSHLRLPPSPITL